MQLACCGCGCTTLQDCFCMMLNLFPERFIWIFLQGECFVHLACVERTAGESARQIFYKRQVYKELD